jgi:hypothetical protein
MRHFVCYGGEMEGIDRSFDRIERSMNDGFARLSADIRELSTEMAAFQRLLLQLSSVALVALVVCFASLIARL